jgi:hypothetical protein
MHTKFYVKNMKGRGHLEETGVERIILKWIIKK